MGRTGGYILLSCLCAACMCCGCASMPVVKLDDCVGGDAALFSEHFRFDCSGAQRFRYVFRRSGKELACNGVAEKTEQGQVKVAGFGDSGITLFAAIWADGNCSIIKNNTGMSDAFLNRTVFGDLLLRYRPLPVDGGCMRRNEADGSWWLTTDTEWSGVKGCFILADGQYGWSGLANGRVVFKAMMLEGAADGRTIIGIENYRDAYKAEVVYMVESSN